MKLNCFCIVLPCSKLLSALLKWLGLVVVARVWSGWICPNIIQRKKLAKRMVEELKKVTNPRGEERPWIFEVLGRDSNPYGKQPSGTILLFFSALARGDHFGPLWTTKLRWNALKCSWLRCIVHCEPLIGVSQGITNIQRSYIVSVLFCLASS